MSNTGEIPPEGQQPEGKPDAGAETPPEGKADEKLGDAGIKALQAERDARKALETQLTQLKTGLATALGVEAKDAKSSTDDIVATLQQQMSDLQHNNLVLTLANENNIADKEDLALLRGFKGDEDGLRKLAARLTPAKTPESEPTAKRRIPAPDPSQGKGGSAKLSGREEGLAQARKRFPQPTK